jgi:hypothetical protein
MGKAGVNSFRFSGRLDGHALAPGTYRLAASQKPGASTEAQTVTFTVLP